MHPDDLHGAGGPLGVAAPLYDIDGGKAKPAWDERRGVHLLSPGDLIRVGAHFWEVTGVYLSTAHGTSTVSIKALDDDVQMTVPLAIAETCAIYLRAMRKELPR